MPFITNKSVLSQATRWLFVLAACCLLGFPCQAAVSVEQLRCEYLDAPLGIDAKNPQLSWILSDSKPGTLRGLRQTAYQILVASTLERLAKNTGDLWDSGKVTSDQTAHIEYAGTPLASRQQCFWKVNVWVDSPSTEPKSCWSKPAQWEMGLLTPADWKAQWIEAQVSKEAPDTVPILRKTLALAAKPVVRARLYITALGLYQMTINGQRVGDIVFGPEWTDYKKRIRYQVYDVSALMKKGDNVLAGLVGQGWYCGTLGSGPKHYGKSPALLAQLEVTYADGTREQVVSDASWKIAASPILSSDFMRGENYDARLEVKGWNELGLDDSAWKTTFVREGTTSPLESQVSQPVRSITEIKSKTITEPKPGCWTVDLGQNMVGYARIKVSAPAGTKLTLRHAEMLSPDGTLYTENLRKAPSIDTYICKGGGVEVFQPHF